MRKIIILIAILLTLESCAIQLKFRSSGGRRSKVQYNRNSEKVSNVLRSGKVVEYKNFDNWENDYLEDLNFEIFKDSSNRSVAILSDKKQKISQKKVSVSAVNDNDLDIMIDKIEAKLKYADEEVLSSMAVIRKDEIAKITREDGIKISAKKDNKEYVLQTEYKRYEKRVIDNNRKVRLSVVNFSDFQGFYDDITIRDALYSFAKSCDVFLSTYNANIKTQNISFGVSKDWHSVCLKLKKFNKVDISVNSARDYFGENFVPIMIEGKRDGSFTPIGTFTGYYELDLAGSKTKSGRYQYPLYSIPKECLRGSCDTRKEINNGSLSGRGLELYWAMNPLEIFLLQVQGSGIVTFENGGYERVGFAGTNKQSGRNVFAYLKKKCIPRCNASLSEMIEWFEDNPSKGNDYIEHTDSYIFFRKLEKNGDGAIGAQGIPLTPSRSVAVDNEMIPYGTPLWLETKIPVKDKNGSYVNMNRMIVAQDTGEAIVGAVRGDIFFGHGTKAKYLAKRQKFQGRYYALVPIEVLSKVKVL